MGFTLSFFIGGLAFTDPALESGMKIGVLGGSILSAALGFVLLRFCATSRGNYGTATPGASRIPLRGLLWVGCRPTASGGRHSTAERLKVGR